MKEKIKGFTLVELLAVIVILALIGLIATPIILNVIKDVKKEATKSSALGYIDAIEKKIIEKELDEETIKDGVYSVEEIKEIGINIKGTSPENGNIKIEKGEVKKYDLIIDGYSIINGEIKEAGTTKKIANGTAVYYNPVEGKKCTKEEAVSTTGTKSGCMKWYAFNDTEGSSSVNIILDHNTTANVVYNSSGNNSEMKEVLEALESDTKAWKNTARLITANEVAKITNHPTFDASKTGQQWYCLATNKKDSTSMPYCNKETNISMNWLFDYTYCKEGSNDWGCSHNDTSTYGYWTSTPYTGSSSIAWHVDRIGVLDRCTVSYSYPGVRPVITVLKSKVF